MAAKTAVTLLRQAGPASGRSPSHTHAILTNRETTASVVSNRSVSHRIRNGNATVATSPADQPPWRRRPSTMRSAPSPEPSSPTPATTTIAVRFAIGGNPMTAVAVCTIARR